MKRPVLEPHSMELDVDYVNRLLGMQFKEKDVREYLERMRFGVWPGNQRRAG